jgi:hypothetical protein
MREAERGNLVGRLMEARRAVRGAKKRSDREAWMKALPAFDS